MRNLQTLSRIMTAYGYPAAELRQVQQGYRNHAYTIQLNDGRLLNLMQYKRESGIVDRIKRVNWLGAALADAGLPARSPADPRILQVEGRSTTQFGLYHYLPGATIPWEAYTQRHLKLTGLALGRLHKAMAQLQTPDGFRRHTAAQEIIDLHERISHYFDQPAAEQALQSKLHLKLDTTWLAQQTAILTSLTSMPRQQPLHLDFVRSNLLFAPAQPADTLQFDGLALTGIIDFEKAAWGAPVIDVARTLAFLLIDCKYKSASEVTKYFLQSGYHKRGGGVLTGQERASLAALVSFFLVHDFYKFLRHNPYETLPQNEHFRRTVGLLLQRRHLSIAASALAKPGFQMVP